MTSTAAIVLSVCAVARGDSNNLLPNAPSVRLDAAHEATWSSDPVELEFGQSYTLSATVRTKELAGGTAELSMTSFPVGVCARAGLGGGVATNGSRVSIAFTATSSRDSVRCAAHGPSGDATFDAIELVPSEPETLAAEAVQRCGPAWRHDQAGWIRLHVEGDPYPRGYQHGTLLAKEIAEFARRSARSMSATAPAEAWKWARTICNALFLRGYCEELLLEMKGIADGAAAHGAKLDDRPLDLLDVVTINSWAELMCLDESLANTPTGLEGKQFKNPYPPGEPAPHLDHCSAFAATGPATRDGHCVIGHITMFGIYVSKQFNVMIDVTPSDGHRVLMQGFPGAIESGMDWFQNDAGLVITETTIGQGPFERNGRPECDRARRAAQYASTIDEAVAIFSNGDNGLYANEWMFADAKTDEIAMLELGTYKTKLWRSSKDEWPAGTKGFYWGCNNTKDPAVASEYVADPRGKPAELLFRPHDRDLKWLELFGRSRKSDGSGTIDLEWGTRAFATPPICGAPSLDAKVTTGEMAKHLESWAYYGRPNGRTWEPTDAQKRELDDVTPITSNGWTVVRCEPPATRAAAAAKTADSASKRDASDESTATVHLNDHDDGDEDALDKPLPEPPNFEMPWRGSFTAASDRDLWLAAGAPRYYAIAEEERKAELAHARATGGDAHDGDDDAASDDDAKSKERHDARSRAIGLLKSQWLAASMRGGDRPLDALKFDFTSDLWHHLAEQKGALVLHELRRALGDDKFFATMKKVGEKFAGQPVATSDLRAAAEDVGGKPLDWFFEQWLTRTGLPRLELADVTSAPSGLVTEVSATIRQSDPPYRMPIVVALVSAKGEERQTVWLEGRETKVSFRSRAAPKRIVVDPDGDAAIANGGVPSVSSWMDDLDHALIVYGTAREEPANRYAAELLHRHFLQGWWQRDLPVKRDVDVTADDRANFHLVLLGRPETNSVAAEFAAAFPIAFSGRGFALDGATWTRADDALVESATSPAAASRELVLFGGASGEATWSAAARVPEDAGYVRLQQGKPKRRGFALDAALARDL
jgi:hypothetical protein